MSSPPTFRYGFLTNQLVEVGMRDPEDLSVFCRDNGFSSIELGPTLELTPPLFETLIRHGIAISDLIYCRNTQAADPAATDLHVNGIRERIEWASRYGIPMVTTSGGYRSDAPGKETYDRYQAIRALPSDSVDGWVDVFGPLVDLAEKRGVRLAFENCPLMQNWAISPVMWRQMFARLDSPLVGLVYDPSHLIWQFIEPYGPIHEFSSRIFAIHAKDTVVDRARLRETGILTDFSWWRYVIPGGGEIDWPRFLRALIEVDFSGPITIEHEDAAFTGSVDDVKDGIIKGLRHLISSERQVRSQLPAPTGT